MKVPSAIEERFNALPPHFFGSIEAVFQDGALVLIKTIATEKFYNEAHPRKGNYPNVRNNND